MHVPGIRTRHSPRRKMTHGLSFGDMVLEIHALNAKSCGQPDPNGCQMKRTHKHRFWLSPATSACHAWHTWAPLCMSPVPNSGTQAHASAPTQPSSSSWCTSPAECSVSLPIWPTGLRPAGRATTHGAAMLPHILCVSGRQLEEEQFPSPGAHTMSGCSGDLNLPSAAPHVPPFRPGLADWGLTLPEQCR